MCDTLLEVTERDLETAAGFVKCGRCLGVFNGVAQLRTRTGGTNLPRETVMAVLSPSHSHVKGYSIDFLLGTNHVDCLTNVAEDLNGIVGHGVEANN